MLSLIYGVPIHWDFLSIGKKKTNKRSVLWMERSISSSSKGITVMYIALRRSCSGLYCMKIGIEEKGVTEESEKKEAEMAFAKK